MPLYGVDIFSGIGGFSLAMEACGIQPIIHVENDKERIRDLEYHWPKVPIIEDVNDIDGIERIVLALREPMEIAPGQSKELYIEL